ncbi:prepilin-type N-terminal cleavage/methylation domain-containing protein [Photobacterium andalusiense]|uniref:Type II secretion system protein G n=1 Tax=Photobacterium andalusiense TaxID=2204296 RepID=A0A1Y6MFT9_9GAMM|nr:prepilin-type N-terminal cleavage/methylation domain-containing protein [Photobacterium andalusiense]SMY35445.1 hypothetical protein PAND9192_02123 [Photobacterium andalusiense]
MKKNGFTLIELIVVIIILGILAVVAMPRFLNTQKDANNAALKGLEAAVNSGLKMGYSKMAIAGLENQQYVTNAPRTDATESTNLPFPQCKIGMTSYCQFSYGYPSIDNMTLHILVENLGQNNTSQYGTGYDWTTIISTDNTYSHSMIITATKNTKPNGTVAELKTDNCYLRYSPPTTAGENFTLKLVPCK